MKHFTNLLIALLLAGTVFGQAVNTGEPVYLRFPTIPAFTIEKAPNATAFTRDHLNKQKKTMFFVFSPDCGHCQKETEMMIDNMDKLKNIQIVMVTYFPREKLMAFYNHYRLGRFSNITVGRDAKYFFPSFYNVKFFPSFYIYDQKGNFKKFLEGEVSMDAIETALNS